MKFSQCDGNAYEHSNEVFNGVPYEMETNKLSFIFKIVNIKHLPLLSTIVRIVHNSRVITTNRLVRINNNIAKRENEK